ncbi:MAG: phosphoglycerate dehydrogenase [Elusimicrobia bacterium]|nr:phosphoglycerate dehydrogenase [Elusimicrobiota bacterium]
MFKIKTLNKISPSGLKKFPLDNYEIGTEISQPEAILVRSADMLQMEMSETLQAIGRAGAGVNNIPVDKCTGKGIVVFNTPGANANAVKELVLGAMFLSARNLPPAIEYCKTLIGKRADVPPLVEKNKGQFAGNELKGKKLGLIGLGAIGVMVANDALALGLTVEGFDPFISVESAWKLSNEVKNAKGMDRLLATSDYISIHVPLTDKTKGLLNTEKFGQMKKGVRIFNFSRGGIVNNEHLKKAIADGIVACYVTDFPDDELLNMDKVICLPHLGASTEEAEENCASMVVDQVIDFLEHGNITNSVNFPGCVLERNPGTTRLTIINKNVPGMVAQLSTVCSKANLNIIEMINKSKGDLAYNIIDVAGEITDKTVEKIAEIENIIKVRALK